MSKFTTKTAKLASEVKYGIKLLVHFRKVGNSQVGTGVFRGHEINVRGKDNSEVLRKLFDLLTKLVMK